MRVVRTWVDAYGHAQHTQEYENASVRQLSHNSAFVDDRFELRVDDHPIAEMQGGRSYMAVGDGSTVLNAMWVDGFVPEDDEDGKLGMTPWSREHWSIYP